jgi:hypothetical protein
MENQDLYNKYKEQFKKEQREEFKKRNTIYYQEKTKHSIKHCDLCNCDIKTNSYFNHMISLKHLNHKYKIVDGYENDPNVIKMKKLKNKTLKLLL